jgi:phytoene dehydrogenase-like protein
MASRHAAVVIGGGHNGLICAAYLAGRLGGSVLVLERRDIVGGSCVTEEIYPGFRYTTTSQVLGLLRPQIIRDLRLHDHGFDFLPMACTFLPFPDGRYLLLGRSEEEDRRSLSVFSERDAETYPRFGRLLGRLADAVRPTLDRPPPDLAHPGVGDVLNARPFAGALRRLSPFERGQLVKLLTMSAAAYLEEWFESDQARVAGALSAVLGIWGSPRTPGTAFNMLHWDLGEMGEVPGTWGFARGGMGGLAEALASAARARGADIRTGAPVARIVTEGGRARGVVLEDGERIDADVVVSGADPKRTYLGMVDRSDLPEGFVRGIERIRMTGNSAKVNLALSELPDFTALPGDGPHLRGDIHIAGGDPDYLERAFDDYRAGRWSSEPLINAVIPSTLDDSLAPPGQHMMSIAVRFAPYRPAAGPWDDASREAFGDAVVRTFARYAPNLPNAILHRQVLTPLDFEEIYGLTGGSIVHGDMATDQLFSMRPVPGWAGYRTPVAGLYLCGSGAHPGGAVMGAPGRNAATVILKDRSRRGRRG